MDLLEPRVDVIFCSIGKMRHGNVPSLHRCYWFYGLELFKGTFERLHKKSKRQIKTIRLPARVCPLRLFVLRSRPCSPEGGVKTPAVKPCIVDITHLPCSVGSKELSAYRFIVCPISYCNYCWLTW